VKFTISIPRESCTNAKAKYSSSVVPPDPSVHFYHRRTPIGTERRARKNPRISRVYNDRQLATCIDCGGGQTAVVNLQIFARVDARIGSELSITRRHNARSQAPFTPTRPPDTATHAL